MIEEIGKLKNQEARMYDNKNIKKLTMSKSEEANKSS